MDGGPNAAQVEFWNEAGGRAWAKSHEALEQQILTLGEVAITALAPMPGERVLDIGCGAGATSLALAEAVGPAGRVVGVDVSRPLLAIAERRGAAVPNLRFVEADAQTHGFDHGGFDAAFSRFGVMFFADPVAALANIRVALRPGGRLAFVCWRGLPENGWMHVPLAAAMPLLPPMPAPDPEAPGPFAFANCGRVEAILGAAGFQEVAIRPHDSEIGGNDLATTMALLLKVGPIGAVLREAPELAPKVEEAVADALAPYVRNNEIWLPGAVWIVTARA
ncbi:class I SAM-dependent methyltransferase [Thermaurantiacus sp.]